MGNGSMYLVKVEPNANNNKFYKMIDLGDSFEVNYGRIGNTTPQKRVYPISRWDSTLRSKLKKGYEDQTRLVAEEIKNTKGKDFLDIENKAIATIIDRIQSKAKNAVKQNYTISSANVTQAMIDEAQVYLNKLSLSKSVKEFNQNLLQLFKTIPRKMKSVSENMSKSDSEFGVIIKNEQDLLDVMAGQVIQKTTEDVENDVEQPTKNILEAMGLIVEETTAEDVKIIKKELGEIADKYHASWRVTNDKTQKKFNSFVQNEKISDTRLLWHGTRSENVWSIMQTGLILRPQAHITGKMFGYGIYYAPKARKSLGYTSINGSYWARGGSNEGFMFLFDVAYGTPYNAHSFDSKYSRLTYKSLQDLKHGANCLHAHSGKMLRNDEIIVYKEEQSTVKYLVELR